MDKILENEIKTFMAAKLAEGVQLSEIQSLVNAEFKQNMTYMDVRILASELEVDWKKFDPEKKAEAPAEAAPAQEAAAPAEEDVAEEAAPAAPEMPDLSDTKIEVSKIARPGMMLSGSVKFASGSTAEWYVDNMGRLGLENLVGEKPTQEDVEKFQIELDKAVRKVMGR